MLGQHPNDDVALSTPCSTTASGGRDQPQNTCMTGEGAKGQFSASSHSTPSGVHAELQGYLSLLLSAKLRETRG
jgi:hypothetical protein